uniref:Uncharacterized protein n=1 Tax=Arundo donax TaxID=35708 RepID=A0A0A9BK72_ARUDO
MAVASHSDSWTRVETVLAVTSG